MTTRPTIVIADTKSGLPQAFEEIFAPFGGVDSVIPAGSKVYVKPNGVYFSPGSYTDPTIVDALLSWLSDHGYRRLALMENSTHGIATRLVFAVTGYDRIARRHGAEAVYLDEGRTVPYALEGESAPIRIARRLFETFIDPARRPGNFYLSLPKLKTHSMATVTLGVKNQQAFPIDEDRMYLHTHKTLHERLARLYRMLQPDFCIIEGVNATFNGHIPPQALLAESSAPLNVLIGGRDTVAVDAVGARALGYAVEEVEHLRLVTEQDLGEGRLENIDVVGDLGRFGTRYPFAIQRRFREDVRIVEGRERACVEGCKGNTECVLEILSNDYASHGGFSIVFGRGFDGDLADLQGDILVVGPCAIRERGEELRRRYAGRRIVEVNAHNDLRGVTTALTSLMGVRPLDMVPLSRWRTLMALAQARLHGLNSRVPPLFGR
jgi:uncharacterized protein (DUF362 family)